MVCRIVRTSWYPSSRLPRIRNSRLILANARNNIESRKEIRFQQTDSKQQPQCIEWQRAADKPERINRIRPFDHNLLGIWLQKRFQRTGIKKVNVVGREHVRI